MRIIIDCDEWYPVYTLSSIEGEEEESIKYYTKKNRVFDVSDEFVKEYEEIRVRFDAFQNKMRDLWHKT